MWIEIVNAEATQTIGAVNSEACDLIRIDKSGPTTGALIRNASTNEVYKTRVSYLRLIEAITQAEAEGLKQIAEIVKDAEELKGDRAAPRIVLALLLLFAVLFPSLALGQAAQSPSDEGQRNVFTFGDSNQFITQNNLIQPFYTENKFVMTSKAVCDAKSTHRSTFMDSNRTIVVWTQCVNGKPRFSYWVSKTTKAAMAQHELPVGK